jgi:L-alanine-DL-glutamate epimerase-like enolase superfamily enzyme
MAPSVEGTRANAYRVPLEEMESDGTLEWDATTIVVVRARSGGTEGVGYTYGTEALVPLLSKKLLPLVEGSDALAPARTHARLRSEVRNLGSAGAVAMAISAVDTALWDLKARLLGLSLAELLGAVRPRVPLYWSGGFTSYSLGRLRSEFREARARGFRNFKMKVGRDPASDPERVRAAREAIGPGTGLFVDANGAYSVRQALALAEAFRASGITWFEEPVPAQDLAGLARVRAGLPPGVELATGEYGSAPHDFQHILAAGACDVLQADATRCGGVTGFLAAASLSSAWNVPFSSHTAPSLHAHLCAAVPEPFRQLEYFRDHARLEPMIFSGVLEPEEGLLTPEAGRPGLGLTLKEGEASRFEVTL